MSQLGFCGVVGVLRFCSRGLSVSDELLTSPSSNEDDELCWSDSGEANKRQNIETPTQKYNNMKCGI